MKFIDLVVHGFSFYTYALRSPEKVGVCISRGTAAVINVGIVFLAVPMGKRIISLVRGLIPLKITLMASSLVPPGKTIHLIVAWTILIASVCHSLSHIVNVINYSRHYLADVPEINMASFKGQVSLDVFLWTMFD
ncbi:NADPH oxidase 4 [Armadillidium vulgare]|nr:NADPH oxidase 4 [Armadillidium vulgare]